MVFEDLPVYLGYFDVLGYQLLFIAGAFIGYMQHTNPAQLHRLYKPEFLCVAAGVAIFFFMLRFHLIHLDIPEFQKLITKPKVGPLRLLNISAMVYLFAFLLHKFPHWMRWQPLVLLGQHSLQVFTFHLVLVLLFQPLVKEESIGKPAVVLCIGILVLSLFIPAYVHQWYQEKNKKLRLQQVRA
jgi:hypothetical protein